MMKFIQKTPLAISGLALSLAALGTLLSKYSEAMRLLCGSFSVAVLCLFAIKLAVDSRQVKEDIKNPVVLSASPTATMALMLLCVYAKPYIGSAAVCVWYMAIAAHLLIMGLFFRRFVIRLKIETVFPSWFVAGVGVVAVSVTSPAMGPVLLGQAAFYTGFSLYFILLPLIVFRRIKLGPFPEPARPTSAIFTAPMSLCMVGYFSVSEQPDTLLVYGMLTVAVISYVYVLINMASWARLQFYPTFAALTFPCVISATAFNAANAFLINNGHGFFSFVPVLSECIAVVVVIYVLTRYALFFVSGHL